MQTLVNLLLISLVLSNLLQLGSGRIDFGIRAVAWQGVIVGVLSLFLAQHGPWYFVWLTAAISIGIKAFAFPYFLGRAMRSIEVRRDDHPPLGYIASTLAGVVLLALAFQLTPLPDGAGHGSGSPFTFPVAQFTLLSGLFLIVARNHAINQILGYLVMENGIFLIGMALMLQEPFLVELGILLDVFAAVFVMGIAVFHISKTFDSIEVDRLSSLRD